MLNVKKMLTKLAKQTGSEFTGISPTTSKITSGSAYLTYDKSTKTCRVDFWFMASTDILSTDVLFTIPAKYKPSDNYNGVGFFKTSSDIIVPYYIRVMANGTIIQGVGNTIRSGMGHIEYRL